MKYKLENKAIHRQSHSLMPLAWFEGLQLLPQHFQAIDARVDAVVNRHLQMVQPHFWGIDELHINIEALASGKLAIVQVSGCFPDGLVFEWSASQDGVIEFDLENEGDISRYCLVVAYEDFNNKGLKIKRYDQFISMPLGDVVVNDEEATLIRLKPRVSIRKYQRDEIQFAQIPLVDIIRHARGFEIGAYHPPAVRIIVGSSCHRNLVNFAKSLREKASLIKANPVTIISSDDYQNSLGWIFNTIASGLIKLECILGDETAHPLEVYRVMCNIIADTSGLTGFIPPKLPEYSHCDIAERFELLIDIARRAITPLGVERCEWRSHPFQLLSGEWRVVVPDNFQGDEFLVRVTFDPVVAVGYVQSWLENVLIYISGQKENFREMRVRGLDRRLDTDPPEFGGSFNNIEGSVFRVFLNDSTIGIQQNLIIENPDERHGLKIKALSLMHQKIVSSAQS